MTTRDYWHRFNARQRQIEKKFAGAMYQAVKGQYIMFLNAVRSRGYEAAKRDIDNIVNFEGVVKVLKRLYRNSSWIESNYVGSSLIKNNSRFARQGLTTQGKGANVAISPTSFKRVSVSDASFSIGFDEIADLVDEYFKIYQLNISGLPIRETTVKDIQDRLIREVESGVPLEQAIKNFREWALPGGENQSSRSKNRAQAIIQTESTRAMSFGGLIGAYMSGVDVEKVWVTSDDERVREGRFSHVVLDRQVSTLFGAFRNGETIKFPGDPDASKGNTIRCRCTQYFRQKARPRPRVTGRKITNFLVDFFSGFFLGSEIMEVFLGQQTSE
jgi:hypothetical protein